MKRKPKARIKQNIWGNWNAYLGRNKVQEFGSSEYDAKEWLRDQLTPRQTYGDTVHPVTGEVAPEGKMWVQNHMSREWFLEGDRTPYYCSPSSEAYWSM
jgi:hypothetical protein